MQGWKSKYDYDGMSNVEKYMGRRLHVQDNCWGMAKILFIILAGIIFWLIISGDLNPFSGIKNFLSYLK